MGNLTENTSCCSVSTFEEIPTTIKVLTRMDGLIVVLLNVLLLSCLLCCRKRFREHSLWTQMISLCINDLFSGICMILISCIDDQPFRTSRFACRLVVISASLSFVTTLLNIFAIGVHRLWIILTIHRQGQGKQVTNKPFAVQITLITLLGIMFILISALSWPVEGHNDVITVCDLSTAYAGHTRKATLFVSSSVFLPFFLTHIVYGILLLKLKRALRIVVPIHNTQTSSRTTNDPAQSSTAESQRHVVLKKAKINREKNVFVLTAIILITIDIFTLPTIAMQMNTALFDNGSQLSRPLKLSIATSITYNSLVNPFIYVIRLSEFRNILRDCFQIIRNTFR